MTAEKTGFLPGLCKDAGATFTKFAQEISTHVS